MLNNVPFFLKVRKLDNHINALEANGSPVATSNSRDSETCSDRPKSELEEEVCPVFAKSSYPTFSCTNSCGIVSFRFKPELHSVRATRLAARTRQIGGGQGKARFSPVHSHLDK
jgi:hypothetical protein